MTQFPNQSFDGGHNPYAGGAAAEPARRGNALGVVGFILSLVSIVTCGCLAPIALIVSFIGMFKSPRGFAVAGSVISGLLTLLLVGMALVGVTMKSMMTQLAAVAATSIEVESFYQSNGRLPDAAEYDGLLRAEVATWPGLFQPPGSMAYRYEAAGATDYVVTLSGMDGVLDTSDDIRQPFAVTGATGGFMPVPPQIPGPPRIPAPSQGPVPVIPAAPGAVEVPGGH